MGIAITGGSATPDNVTLQFNASHQLEVIDYSSKMEYIGETILSGAATSISVTGIPNTYKLLLFEAIITKDANAQQDVQVRLDDAAETYIYQLEELVGAVIAGSSRSVATIYAVNNLQANEKCCIHGTVHIRQGVAVSFQVIGGGVGRGNIASGQCNALTTVDTVLIQMAANNMAAGSCLRIWGGN